MSSAEPDQQPTSTKVVTPLLSAALVAAVLFAGLWLMSRSTSPDDIDRALAQEAPKAHDTAEEVIELLVNLDAESVDVGGERTLELSTGDFRDDYEELLPGLGPASRRRAPRRPARSSMDPTSRSLRRTQRRPSRRSRRPPRSTEPSAPSDSPSGSRSWATTTPGRRTASSCSASSRLRRALRGPLAD